MRLTAALRTVQDGQKRVLRLQRRLWLAELALRPSAIVLGIAVSAGVWAFWQRQSRKRRADGIAPGPADAPEPVTAGPGG